MLIKNPAQCRVSGYQQNTGVKNAINKYIVVDYAHLKDKQLLNIKRFKQDNAYLEPVILYGLSSLESDVPALSFPYVNQDNNWIALDLRQSVMVDKNTMTARVKNEGEYQFAVQRFVLSGMWMTGRHESLYNLRLPHVCFADWLANSLTRKFGLDMQDQIKLFVLCSIYYATLFTDHFTSEDLDKIKVVMKSEIAVSSLIDQVYLDAGVLNSLDDFCKACHSVTNNVRLKSLDFNVLVSVLANTWYGVNAQESILMSLEHPPTWIAIVYTSLMQRSYKNSAVSKYVDNRNKRGSGKDFLKELTSVTLDYKGD